MKKKQIPTKNYIIAICLIILSTIVGIYLINTYSNRKNYYNSESKTMAFLPELEADNLDSYLIENHEAIIYISSSSDKTLQKYEKELKKFIIKENLESSIVYLDANNLDDNFYSNLKNNYVLSDYDVDFKSANPNIIIIEDGQITNVLYKESHSLSVEEAKQFLKENVGV